MNKGVYGFPKVPPGAFTFGSSAPTIDVKNGDLWFDAANGRLLIYLDDGSSRQWVGISAGAVPLFQGGQLTKSGANILFAPFKGNQLVINGALQTIPDAGITLGVGGLAASTTYFIYAFMNGTVMTLETSATGHSTQAGTGVEIKTGDGTRTLVGMARTTAGTAWADTAAQRFVISWFNQRLLGTNNIYTANRTTTSVTTFAEPNTEIHSEFLLWANQQVDVKASGSWQCTIANNATAAVAFDSATSAELIGQIFHQGTANQSFGINFVKTGLAEGYHYGTLLGAVASASTLTFFGGAASATTPNAGTNVPTQLGFGIWG